MHADSGKNVAERGVSVALEKCALTRSNLARSSLLWWGDLNLRAPTHQCTVTVRDPQQSRRLVRALRVPTLYQPQPQIPSILHVRSLRRMTKSL